VPPFTQKTPWTSSRLHGRIPAIATLSEAAMTSNLDLKPTQSGVPQTDGAVRWLLASVPLWVLAGFICVWIPARTVNSIQLMNLLIHIIGLPERLAYSIAFATLYLPLTILLATSVAAAQCIIHRVVRPWARRWVLAAAAGGAIAWATSLALAPLLTRAQRGNSVWLVLFHYLLRGALLGAFISILQRWSMRGRVIVPGWFVVASSLAGGAGAFGVLVWALSVLKALR